MLSDSFINQLIACSKVITTSPRKEMITDRQHLKNDMKVCSKDGQYNFSVFMRKSDIFEENFSIGLIYHPTDVPESIVLIRCNGPHGPHKLFQHHNKYHIHISNEENMKLGVKPERHAIITNEYSTYQEALKFFIKKCNIEGTDKYFFVVKQLSMFK